MSTSEIEEKAKALQMHETYTALEEKANALRMLYSTALGTTYSEE